MSDEEIRRLELEATDDVGRVRLARALERAGRRDEAFEQLLLARESEEARESLATFPAWNGVGGGAGHTRYVDVPAVQSRPRVLWRWRAPSEFRYEVGIASALGIFVDAYDELRSLDPVSGQERWLARGTLRRLAGTRLATTSGLLDAWTGVSVLENEADSYARELDVLADGSRLSAPGEPSLLSRRSGAGKELWTRDTPDARLVTNEGLSAVRATEERIVVPHGSEGGRRVAALDAKTGETLFRVPGMSATGVDRAGFIAYEAGASVLYDWTGRQLWRARGGVPFLDILGSTFVVLVRGHEHLEVRARESGALLGTHEGFWPRAAAREVIDATDHYSVAAVTPAGKRLWSFELGAASHVVAPVPGRVVVQTPREILCLG